MATPECDEDSKIILERLQNLSITSRSRLCRGCLTENDETVSLFKIENKETLAVMFSSLICLQVPFGDGLPESLCKHCSELLVRYYDFKQLCQRSELALQSLLNRPSSHQLQFSSQISDINRSNSDRQDVNIKEEKSDLLNYDMYLDDADIHSSSPKSVLDIVEVISKADTDLFNMNSNAQPQTKQLSITKNDSISIKPKLKLKKRLMEKKLLRRGKSLNILRHNRESDKSDEANLTDRNSPESAQKELTYNKKSKTAIFVCTECGKQFPNHHRLIRHKRIHQKNKMYNCDICQKGFNEQRDLIRHTQSKQVHKNLEKSRSIEKNYQCSHCQMAFTTEGDLQIHSSIHINAGEKCVCQRCNKEFETTIQLKRHVRTHFEDKPHKCSKCSKSFSEMGALTRHFRQHTGEIRERKYVCTHCNKSYFDRYSLKIHARIHTGEKPWECNECGRRFTDARLLNSHKKTHSDSKPFTCNTCGKSFRHVSTLVTHIRTHTGEKPYICSVCGNGFIQSSNLSLHMRTHTREKPYTCRLCDKKFTSSSALRIHTRIHTGVKWSVCFICCKRMLSNEMKAHMRTHENGLIKCNVCKEVFPSTEDVMKHMLQHENSKGQPIYNQYIELRNGEAAATQKPFVCIMCNKGFTTSVALKKHLSRVHNMITLSLDSVCAKASTSLTNEFGEPINTGIVIQSGDVMNIPNSLAISGSNINLVTVNSPSIGAGDLNITTLPGHQIVSGEVGTIVTNALITDDKIYQIDPELLRLHSTGNLTHSTQITIAEVAESDN